MWSMLEHFWLEFNEFLTKIVYFKFIGCTVAAFEKPLLLLDENQPNRRTHLVPQSLCMKSDNWTLSSKVGGTVLAN